MDIYLFFFSQLIFGNTRKFRVTETIGVFTIPLFFPIVNKVYISNFLTNLIWHSNRIKCSKVIFLEYFFSNELYKKNLLVKWTKYKRNFENFFLYIYIEYINFFKKMEKSSWTIQKLRTLKIFFVLKMFLVFTAKMLLLGKRNEYIETEI